MGAIIEIMWREFQKSNDRDLYVSCVISLVKASNHSKVNGINVVQEGGREVNNKLFWNNHSHHTAMTLCTHAMLLSAQPCQKWAGEGAFQYLSQQLQVLQLLTTNMPGNNEHGLVEQRMGIFFSAETSFKFKGLQSNDESDFKSLEPWLGRRLNSGCQNSF